MNFVLGTGLHAYGFGTGGQGYVGQPSFWLNMGVCRYHPISIPGRATLTGNNIRTDSRFCGDGRLMLMDRSHRPWMYFSVSVLLLIRQPLSTPGIPFIPQTVLMGQVFPVLFLASAGTLGMFFAGCGFSVRRTLAKPGASARLEPGCVGICGWAACRSL